MSTFPQSVQSLTVAKLSVGELTLTGAGALGGVSKQGAVAGSDFTMTSASFANVTAATVTTGGAAVIVASAQIIAAASVTTAQLQLTASAGSITGVWLGMVDTTTAGDVTVFGASFGAASPNFATANTYEVIFIGWVSAAATVNLQGKSDGTRTLTVKIGSQVASSI